MLRLKELRKKRGLSLKELGDILGVAESTISLYENEKREAPYAILRKLSQYFNVSIDYLLLTDFENKSQASDSLSFPMLSSVSISGDEIELCYSEQNRHFNLEAGEEYFYLKAYDDLMEPQISKGDIALIKKQNKVENGSLAAVIYEGSPVTIKRVIYEQDIIILQPFNPKYKNILITKKNELIILGKVINTIKKW